MGATWSGDTNSTNAEFSTQATTASASTASTTPPLVNSDAKASTSDVLSISGDVDMQDLVLQTKALSLTDSFATALRQATKQYAVTKALLLKQLMSEIKKTSSFPENFWSTIASRRDIALTGSFPLRIALGVDSRHPDWKTQDIDIFVASTFTTQKDQKPAVPRSVALQVWKLLDMENVPSLAQPSVASSATVDNKSATPSASLEKTSNTTKYKSLKGILLSDKRISPKTGHIVNVIVVETGGASIVDYAQATFDLSCCSIATNGEKISVPCEILNKKSFCKPTTKLQRRNKYGQRGFQIEMRK